MGDDNSDQQKKWNQGIIGAVIAFCIIFSVYFGFVHKWVGTIITAVSAVLSICSYVKNVINKNSGNANLKQEDDNEKDEKPSRCKIWWNSRPKWFKPTIAIVLWLFCLFSLFYTVPKIIPIIKGKEKPKDKDSLAIVEQQRQFDELVAIYDSRMKEELPSYDNVCPSINDDFDLLLEILQMLKEHPNLNATPKIQYIGQFKNRADAAIARIRNAIYSTHLTESMRDEMILKYTPCIDAIEKSIDSIEKIRKGL